MSEHLASWSIVGAGNVGSELIGMVAKPEVAKRLGLLQMPDYVLRQDGWHENSPEGFVTEKDGTVLPDTDLLFIASPSTADHDPMLSLTREQIDKGRIVVTAEKGMLADNSKEFRYQNRLGYWATVGGGTKLLPTLEFHTQDPDNIREIHLALNATLTYIFGEASSGRSLVQVVEAAEKLGYSEPGSSSTYDIVNGEASFDVPRKLAIVWNTIFGDLAYLEPNAITTELTEENVLKALNEADKYRYLVSLFSERDLTRAEAMSEDKIGGFKLIHEGWVLIGGLQRVDRTNSIGRFRATSGPEAGFYVNLGPVDQSTNDGETFVMGTGAGGATTANAMLDNYRHIRRHHGLTQ